MKYGNANSVPQYNSIKNLHHDWVMLYENLPNLTGEHKSTITTVSARQRLFEEMNCYKIWENEFHWVNQNNYVAGGIYLCEKYGHMGDGHADAENGSDSFQCHFCDFGYSVYM